MTINEWKEDFKGYINALAIPRDDYNGIMEYIDEGAALLKEQESKFVQNIGKRLSCKSGTCPNCGKMLNEICNKHFCGKCGKAVKWE